MTSVQITGVPDDFHATLRRRAAEAHQSLQGYLLGRLIDDASHPTLSVVLHRAGERPGVSAPFADTAELVRLDRHSR